MPTDVYLPFRYTHPAVSHNCRTLLLHPKNTTMKPPKKGDLGDIKTVPFSEVIQYNEVSKCPL